MLLIIEFNQQYFRIIAYVFVSFFIKDNFTYVQDDIANIHLIVLFHLLIWMEIEKNDNDIFHSYGIIFDA
jgi:hypothetical protein